MRSDRFVHNSFGQSTTAGGHRIIHVPGPVIAAVGHYRYVTGITEPQTVFSAAHHAALSDGARLAACDSHPNQQACSGHCLPNHFRRSGPSWAQSDAVDRSQPSGRSVHSIRRPRHPLGFPWWPAGCHVSVVPAGRARPRLGDRRTVLTGTPEFSRSIGGVPESTITNRRTDKLATAPRAY